VWGERGTNIVDSGAPYYDAYETADGKWLAVGAMEPHFYADLVALLELPDDLPDQNDRAQWPQMKKVFGDAVRGRTLTEWLAAAEGLTPCIAPVLDVDEAPSHPHHVARGAFVDVDGLVQPAPAPRFSRTAATVDRRPPMPGEHTTEILTDWGIDPDRSAEWLRSGAVREAAAET
jgi:alpha-methylacyl-CoA racemase